MTIHFCTNHFIDSGLELIEYMILLIHETSQPSLTELSSYLNISERTAVRTRNGLINNGYLRRDYSQKGTKYILTDKMYQDEPETINTR